MIATRRKVGMWRLPWWAVEEGAWKLREIEILEYIHCKLFRCLLIKLPSPMREREIRVNSFHQVLEIEATWKFFLGAFFWARDISERVYNLFWSQNGRGQVVAIDSQRQKLTNKWGINQCFDLKWWFSTGDFCPQGTFGNIWRHLGYHNPEVMDATCIY